MNNADFDTPHPKSSSPPGDPGSPVQAIESPQKPGLNTPNPRNPATHHQPTVAKRQPAVLRDSPNPRIYGSFTVRSARPRGSLQKSRTRPGLGSRCGRNPLIRQRRSPSLPLRNGRTTVHQPRPICRNRIRLQARALPPPHQCGSRRSRIRGAQGFRIGRDASACRRRTQASAASGRCGSWLRQRPAFVGRV